MKIELLIKKVKRLKKFITFGEFIKAKKSWLDVEAPYYVKALSMIDLDYDEYGNPANMWDEFIEALNGLRICIV